MVDTLPARFDMKHSFNIPASLVDELGPMKDDDVVTDRSFSSSSVLSRTCSGGTSHGVLAPRSSIGLSVKH